MGAWNCGVLVQAFADDGRAATHVGLDVRSDEVVRRGDGDLEFHALRDSTLLSQPTKGLVRLEGFNIVLRLQLRHSFQRLLHLLLAVRLPPIWLERSHKYMANASVLEDRFLPSDKVVALARLSVRNAFDFAWVWQGRGDVFEGRCGIRQRDAAHEMDRRGFRHCRRRSGTHAPGDDVRGHAIHVSSGEDVILQPRQEQGGPEWTRETEEPNSTDTSPTYCRARVQR